MTNGLPPNASFRRKASIEAQSVKRGEEKEKGSPVIRSDCDDSSANPPRLENKPHRVTWRTPSNRIPINIDNEPSAPDAQPTSTGIHLPSRPAVSSRTDLRPPRLRTHIFILEWSQGSRETGLVNANRSKILEWQGRAGYKGKAWVKQRGKPLCFYGGAFLRSLERDVRGLSPKA